MCRQAKSVTLSGVGLHNAQYIVGPCVDCCLLSGGVYRLLCSSGQRRENSLSSRKAALFWRIAGGVTLGIGIWSMHFIGMLSMQMPMMMSYDLWITLASLGAAVIASTTAINIAVTGKHLSLFRLTVATIILSAGVVSMHYIGMAALMLEEASSGISGLSVCPW